MESLSQSDHAKSGIENGTMAQIVTHVEQYNAHADGERAGVRKGDVLVSVDGKTDINTESAFLASGMNEK